MLLGGYLSKIFTSLTGTFQYGFTLLDKIIFMKNKFIRTAVLGVVGGLCTYKIIKIVVGNKNILRDNNM